MRQIILAILPMIALFLQSTFFSNYSIKGTVPDLVLVFVVFYALLNNGTKGVFYGLACGLLEDLYVGRFIGINALSKAIVAYTVNRLQGNVFRENVLVGVVTVIISSMLNWTVMLLISMASFKVLNINLSILTGLLNQICYNTILSVPLYIWYYNSNRRGLLRAAGD
ncbi:MAG TPA: rod shape-determining protein MreD [Syntrophomonadaceae bacterium]|nr:rod shape-determining protein MreD [Syntrophomonadaceae bacterium]